MPLLIVTYLVQIACAIHALRRGASYPVIFLIVAFPAIGCVVYVVAVILPELSQSKAARDAREKVSDTIAPDRRLKKYAANLEIADSVENKLNLADELRRKGRQDEAIPLLISCLEGPFADNPDVLRRLADAYFETGAFDDCVGCLEHMIEANPDYRSQEAHLLYARALAATGATPRAVEAYRELCAYYSGPEAKCRFAELLVGLGRLDEARALLEEVLLGAKHAPPHLRKRYRDWISLAERQLKTAPFG